MKPSTKYLHFIISLAIVAVCCFLFLLSGNNTNDPVRDGVYSYFIVLVISSTAIVVAIVVLILRIRNRFINQNSFFYNLTGIANFCLGAGYIIFVFLGKLDNTSFVRFALNLLLGSVIIIDIIVKEDEQE